MRLAAVGGPPCVLSFPCWTTLAGCKQATLPGGVSRLPLLDNTVTGWQQGAACLVPAPGVEVARVVGGRGVAPAAGDEHDPLVLQRLHRRRGQPVSGSMCWSSSAAQNLGSGCPSGISKELCLWRAPSSVLHHVHVRFAGRCRTALSPIRPCQEGITMLNLQITNARRLRVQLSVEHGQAEQAKGPRTCLFLWEWGGRAA